MVGDSQLDIIGRWIANDMCQVTCQHNHVTVKGKLSVTEITQPCIHVAAPPLTHVRRSVHLSALLIT
jgi:hypothetical protein